MNKYLILIIISALLGAVIITTIYNNKINYLNDKISKEVNNNKATFAENNDLLSKAKVYKMTIEDLLRYNDSINIKLDSVIKDNKIKIKHIQLLQYIKTKYSKTDTITINDTILCKQVNIDTTLVFKDYKLNLLLHYPNTIITTPTFINELFVIIHNNKETIDPPKKFFLFRWFQKKHIVVTIDIKNSNKYSDIQDHRFIEIIKL